MNNEHSAPSQGLSPNLAAISAFFTRVEHGIHVLSISVTDGVPFGRYFGSNVEGASLFAAQLNSGGNNIYFTPNEPHSNCGHKPNKSQIVRIRAAYVDIDAYKPGSAFDKDGAHRAVLADKPTLVIDSGNGLHAYWELAEPVEATPENVAMVEAVNRALVARYGGDPAATNVDRVLRVSGTVNWPNAKKRELGRVPCMAKVLP